MTYVATLMVFFGDLSSMPSSVPSSLLEHSPCLCAPEPPSPVVVLFSHILLPLKTGEGISTPLFLPPPHLPKNFQLFESHIRGLYSDPSLVVQHLVTSWGELEACCHLLHDSVICFLVVSISTCLSAAPLPAWFQNACKI